MELTNESYIDESSGNGLSRQAIENMVLCVVSNKLVIILYAVST
jgi:hypothetical protein